MGAEASCSLIGRWMLLIAAMIKSAIIEGDKQFIESKWGGYLIEAYEEYQENQDGRWRLPTIDNRR